MSLIAHPTEIYLFKFDNGNTGAVCDTCSKLIINKLERRHKYRSCVSIDNFQQI